MAIITAEKSFIVQAPGQRIEVGFEGLSRLSKQFLFPLLFRLKEKQQG
jgi:hypothetical protein